MPISAPDFLKHHRLRSADIDMQDLVRVFTEDMDLGLAGKAGALRMIPTYIEAGNDFQKDTPVLAIDAGGTNFRAAVVTILSSGKIIIEDCVNHGMPGLNGPISSREFFLTIAEYIRPLANSVGRIGFCFSYPTEILPDRDGRLLQFCKEVQAPEVHGQLIGKNLLETLGTPGMHIVLLNDTVATLLAGKSASVGKKYDSYIGFILGTGTNTCYIEKNVNISKNRVLAQDKSQIINVESGDFARPPRSELDVLFDDTTTDPGSYKFEKMFSGGYFGALALFVMKRAATEGVFTEITATIINNLTSLSTSEASDFAEGLAEKDNALAGILLCKEDADTCRQIIGCLIDRAAKLVASNLSAVLLKTGKGLNEETPVLITVEGTTFYRLYGFRKRFETYFNDYLTGERKRYAEFTAVDQSSLIGAALAGLIE